MLDKDCATDAILANGVNGIKNQIINADCLEVMKQMPDKCVDLCLCDPPYGLDIAKNGSVGGGSFRGKTQIFSGVSWDGRTVSKEYIDEILRVSKNAIIWGGNYYINELYSSRCYLVWYKRDGLPDRTFADCELAWTTFDRNAKVYNIRWDGFIRDSKEDKVAHPTQKPIALFDMCLQDFSTEGQTVLDPFLGSGTTAVACYRTNRNYIGIEISPEYCAIAENRIQAEKDKLSLFAGQL